jgi:hypothetical protein
MKISRTVADHLLSHKTVLFFSREDGELRQLPVPLPWNVVVTAFVDDGQELAVEAFAVVQMRFDQLDMLPEDDPEDEVFRYYAYDPEELLPGDIVRVAALTHAREVPATSWAASA